MRLLLFFICIAISTHTLAAKETERKYSHRDFGGIGLMQMPSARMAETGDIAIFWNRTTPYIRFGVAAQPFDWFEVLFRHVSVSNRVTFTRNTPEDFQFDESYKDKGIDFKLRLWKEDYYLPQVSVGFQDIAGTGLFSSEYVVASKHWHDFDFTLGYAWGYLAGRESVDNPLTSVADRFRTRDAQTGEGGKFNVSNYFSGERAAIFAGIEYAPANLPIVFKLEYDGNDYENEALENSFGNSSPLNFGVVYQPIEEIDLSVGYQRGNQISFGFTIRQSISDFIGQPKIKDRPVQQVSKAKKGQWSDVALKLNEEAGWQVEEISASDKQLSIYGSQSAHVVRAKALGRAARVLQDNIQSYEQIRFVEQRNGFDLNEVTMSSKDVNRVIDMDVSEEALSENTTFSNVDDVNEEVLFTREESPFSYSLSPGLIQSIAGADEFILYQITADANAEWKFTPSSWVSGELVVGLLDNFDKFTFTENSNLHPVRTDIREYLTQSKVRLEYLQLNQLYQPSSSWYTQVYAGYLELMYAGVGGEILYRPHGGDNAIGIDINYVRQRDFDVDFGLRDYDVVTGHVSAYFRLPFWRSVLTQLSVGRYLAQDVGATIDMSRTFDNGARMGFWATKTDVSSEDFGEGSFDKGLYLRYPLNLLSVGSTRKSLDMRWGFLTRDGGARLARKYRLYEMTEDRSVDQQYRHFEQFKD